MRGAHMRECKSVSGLYDGNLALSIAPALTPKGIEQSLLRLRKLGSFSKSWESAKYRVSKVKKGV